MGVPSVDHFSDARTSAMAANPAAVTSPPAHGVCWFDDDLHASRCISPLSDRSPPRSGTNWTRFFPELSSHFSLVSPESTQAAPLSFASPQSLTGRKRFYSTDSTTYTLYTTDSSRSSNELADNASSCYSRRSSITSVGSEPAGAYKSADAFSIISPTHAGVFDDSASIRGAPSFVLAKPPPCASPDNKPLPREPAIQLSPLFVRNSSMQLPKVPGIGEVDQDHANAPYDTYTSLRRRRHQPTLSQAAEELENTLAGLTEPENPLKRSSVLDAPLQISRGNMDMIPSRAPPLPPIDTQVDVQPQETPLAHTKLPKKHHKGKLSFPFNIPGFNRKHNRAHLRSRSSPNILESPIAPAEAAFSPEPLERRAQTEDLQLLTVPHSPRPASADGERELRSKLPRLRTGTPEPVTQPSHDLSSFNRNIAARLQADTQPEEKIFVSSNKRMLAQMKHQTCAIELLQSAPEIVYELDSGCPRSRSTPIKLPTPVYAGAMPGTLPDEVVFAIFKQTCSLDDLFHLATVNKQFYRIFKAHELELIKNTVYTMSPPAWELREMSPPWDSEWQILVDPDAPMPEYTPSNYLYCYAQDIYTLAQLKSLILARCGTFLRPETIRGLAGLDADRAAQIDDAFWRIWTFCRIFGCGKGREGDILGQLDWLRGGVTARNNHKSMAISLTEPFGMNNVLFEPPPGFGQGNRGGLSQKQLYDMTEIWNCLGVLLQPIHGKCKEARETGIYDGHNIPEGQSSREEALLEEWTFYILSLGPSAVLNLGSICPADNGLATFQRAKLIGLTNWARSESGLSRASFLKEAVSKAYGPHETPRRPRRRSPRHSETSSNSSRSSGSTVNSSQSSTDSNGSDMSLPVHRRRQAAYAEQLRNRRLQGPSDNVFVEERPISNYGMIMNRLAGLPKEQPPLLPVSPVNVDITSPISPPHPRRAPPQVPPPVQSPPLVQRVQSVYPMATAYPPQVRDPVDQALETMVRQLGFQEEDAKWALKITDSGEGIDVGAAVDLLLREQQKSPARGSVSSGRSSLVSSVISSRESINSGWRWA